MLEGPAYIHPSALVYGAVTAEPESSLWPNVVIRAEMHHVHIGRRSNLQDFVMVHVGYHHPTIIGEDCSVTHHCTLHGCTLGDRVLVGIGSTMTLPMDARLASTEARMGFVFARLGITPEACSTWFLPRIVGQSTALDLLYSGDIIPASRALEIGLVSRVVTPESLMEETMSLARRIARHPADGVRMTKRLLRMGRNMQINHLLEVSAAMQALGHNTPEHRTALAEAYERISRKPAR